MSTDNFAIPGQPVIFSLAVRLAMTTREPCRSEALKVRPGQPLRLRREPDNPHDSQAIRVDTLEGKAVGYLYADIAGYLAMLLDHYPDLTDDSEAGTVQVAAPPDDPAARRLRYPIVTLRLELHLASAWPLFAIAAVMGIKDEDFFNRYNLPGNPWLQPLQKLHEQYLQQGHDRFHLPERLAKAWVYLTKNDKIHDKY